MNQNQNESVNHNQARIISVPVLEAASMEDAVTSMEAASSYVSGNESGWFAAGSYESNNVSLAQAVLDELKKGDGIASYGASAAPASTSLIICKLSGLSFQILNGNDFGLGLGLFNIDHHPIFDVENAAKLKAALKHPTKPLIAGAILATYQQLGILINHDPLKLKEANKLLCRQQLGTLVSLYEEISKDRTAAKRPKWHLDAIWQSPKAEPAKDLIYRLKLKGIKQEAATEAAINDSFGIRSLHKATKAIPASKSMSWGALQNRLNPRIKKLDILLNFSSLPDRTARLNQLASFDGLNTDAMIECRSYVAKLLLAIRSDKHLNASLSAFEHNSFNEYISQMDHLILIGPSLDF